MLTEFQQAMAWLDEAVTGKSAQQCEHTASSQLKSVAEWYLNSERAWYLSDGGYSRVSCEDNGRLYLTSNSLAGAKDRWTDAAPERQRVESMIRQWLESQL